ncbi:TetR family transcriptional regulator [Thioclava dalianensis]|uniref:TetR family transcriptional regulator n=1 Tax=Thioclava dalianensis TaxID=1185766 RepID=A0A074TG62_9RHOB|nr:TetR/AcrR family transcriptional regulator [Thioclava dalianensis]KEP70691.1 TetR family transcriptional regulator [Thioclava dalianensis]SFN04868.1 transcriptional regulator, TetR family [Thioclava dalianensis]
MADTTQIHRGRKFDQVLAGARDVFLRDGYDGAAVDDIAKEAGVSKATLYSYFPDKRLMFLEVARTECKKQAEQAIASIDLSQPPEIVLTLAARQFIKFMTSELGRGIYRLCVAEGERFPELGRAFYLSGPVLVHETLKGYFEQSIARGELEIDDTDLAAYLFAELCKAELHSKLVFGVCEHPETHDAERVVRGAVEMFLARYGVKG